MRSPEQAAPLRAAHASTRPGDEDERHRETHADEPVWRVRGPRRPVMSSAEVLSLRQPHPSRRPQPLPYPNYPIERRIRSNAHDFQLAFAEEAATRAHQRFDDALLAPGRDGLLI